MIAASEIDCFEAVHGLGRGRTTGSGAPARYDSDQFYVALIRRPFHEGMPASLRGLAREMQEWFIVNSPAEPAEKLLERIHAAREGQPKARRGRPARGG